MSTIYGSYAKTLNSKRKVRRKFFCCKLQILPRFHLVQLFVGKLSGMQDDFEETDYLQFTIYILLTRTHKENKNKHANVLIQNRQTIFFNSGQWSKLTDQTEQTKIDLIWFGQDFFISIVELDRFGLKFIQTNQVGFGFKLNPKSTQPISVSKPSYPN